jgi:hypothetical protein
MWAESGWLGLALQCRSFHLLTSCRTLWYACCSQPLVLLLLLPLLPGVAQGAWDNELELLSAVRELVTYLPLNNR